MGILLDFVEEGLEGFEGGVLVVLVLFFVVVDEFFEVEEIHYVGEEF